MKILFGIIFFHMLVILRCRFSVKEENVPYISVLVLSMLMVGYVVLMLFNMETPKP